MNDLPAVAADVEKQEIEYYSLDPGYIRAERVSGLIFFAVVLIAAIIGLVIRIFVGGFDTLWYWIIGGGGLALVALLWSAVFWPGIAYRHIQWRLDEVGLEINRGVVWRRRISVPFARVQHADVSQGPVQRMYGIGTLTVHTAGTTNASVDVAGLNHGIAMGLRDRLVRQRGSDSNVSS